jgi:Phloem protein 2
VCIDHRERRQFNMWWDMPLARGPTDEMTDEVRLPRERQDEWLEIDLGEFYSGDGTNGEIDTSLMEIRGGHWKRGLVVLGIEVRPKY